MPWIEDSELILRERYGWYEAYGIGYTGGDVRVAARRDGAGRPDRPPAPRRRGPPARPAARGRILPLPGHSPGHVGIWEPASRTAIVMDAVMANGLLDTEGTVIHPPPIVDTAGYEGSVRLLQSLAPERLLTAHYDVIEGAEVGRFLADSLAFVERARRAVAAGGDRPLRELLARANAELGPFTSMPNELAGDPARASCTSSGKERVA